MVPTLLALGLALLWMGNAAASLMFREPYPPQEFRMWVGLSLALYALWHVLKVAWMRPKEDVAWQPAERGVLFSAPFTRRELLTYRLSGVLVTTLFKSLLVALLLLPDLPNIPAGFLGLLLGFGFLELLRMTLEITAFGMRARSYLLFRVAVFGLTGFAAVVALVTAIELFPHSAVSETNSMVHLLGHLLQTATRLRDSWIGRAWVGPFRIFAEVIVASDVLSLKFLAALPSAVFLIGAMIWLVFRLDGRYCKQRLEAEQASYCAIRQSGDAARGETPEPGRRLPRPELRLAKIVRMCGAGPVFWRQWLGAMKHKGGLVIAFSLPAFLSLLPLLMNLQARGIFYNVVAALVFYTFLLLPAALKFDFRRDYDRLSTLKSLPLRPVAVVCGQLATPVLLATLFQLFVLCVALMIRPLPLQYLAGAMLLLFPVNVAIFSVENLIFLMAPHRQNQEGIEVFIRTILVFTAKALLFVVGLSAFLAWGRLGPQLYEALGSPGSYAVAFLGGFLLCFGCAAFAGTALLARAFRRFDPSLDFSG